MNVDLLVYTPNAVELLIYTKNTRLQGEWTIQDIMDQTNEWKMEQIEDMKMTIQGPFEFVDYTFRLTGVSRSFTHQLVRTRNASYAQESLRAVRPQQGAYCTNELVANAQEKAFDEYAWIVNNGTPYQEAREMLPMGTKTSIICKFNLRELGRMAEVRLCKRTAGEYQQVFKLMKEAIVRVHPWAESMLRVACAKTGICIFPKYEECPVRPYTMEISKLQKHTIQQKWEETDHVADPSIRNSDGHGNNGSMQAAGNALGETASNN